MEGLYNHQISTLTHPHQHPHPPQPPHAPQQTSRSGKTAMAFARFPFGIGSGLSRPPSSNGAGLQNAPTSAPRATARMTSRTTELALDAPIQGISANQDGDRVVLAGRDFLRIIAVSNESLQESHSLRIPNRGYRNTSQSEVKWGCYPLKDVIATANSNQTICIYKDGRQDRTLQEHQRQINRLAFNPADGRLLLSASNDGSVKLWDLREKKSRFTFQCKSEAVKDVQFNAANAVEFAAGFENGTIQRWDYRNTNNCEKKVSNAHQGAVYSVAWHPDGRHCASAGRDMTVKVWDFYGDPRRKAKHTVYAPLAVSRVVWRPLGIKTTELAACFIGNDYRIHLWDLKRPYMPTYILNEHTNVITGLQFKDEDMLWSSGKDGKFVQHDVVFGHQPITDLPQAAFAWNMDNELTFATQKRKRIQKFGQPKVQIEDEFALRAEDRKKDRRSSSFKGGGSKQASIVSALDGILEKFQPAQASAKVNLPVFNFDSFEFLAKHYITTLQDGKGMKIGKACERNAKVARHVGEFRTAATWEALAYLLQREEDIKVEQEVQEERERVKRLQEAQIAAAGLAGVNGPGGGAVVARRLLGIDGAQYMASPCTPLSRPVPDTPKSTPMPTPVQMDHVIAIEDTLSLPPAAYRTSVSSSTASTDGGSSPPQLPDEDEDAVALSSEEGEPRESKVSPSSPRPILHVDTTVRRGATKRHHLQPSLDSSVPFFSTSGGGFSGPNSAGEGRRNIDSTSTTEQPSSYEQPRTRPRQYSIGLVSEQTSSSYEDRVVKELQEGRDEDARNSYALDGIRNSLHAIAEEKDREGTSAAPPSIRSFRDHYGQQHNNGVSQANNGNRHGNSHSIPNFHAHGPTTEGLSGSPWYNRPSSKVEVGGSNNPLGCCGIPSAGDNYKIDHNDSDIDDEQQYQPWHPSMLIPQLLAYYTEKGDVQFCATLVNLLAGTYAIPIPRRQIDEWVESYVELLHRKQLLNVAAHVVKYTPSVTVRERGQTDTFVHTACGWCNKPLIGNAAASARKVDGEVGYWYCDNCKKRQDGCVICRRGVRARWVMCQGCGHGGHDECLRDWYFGSASSSPGGAASGSGGGSGRGGSGGRRGGSTPSGEDSTEDDDEPMEMCPAVGCAHECLPR